MSYSLFGTPTPLVSSSGAYTLGIVFSSVLGGDVLGVRFYKTATNTGTHIGSLWDISGTLLASVTFTGETASGWQYMAFASPYTIAANTQYVVSYLCPGVNYSYQTLTLGTAQTGQVLGNPLGWPASAGRYTAGGTNTFPSTVSTTNYFVDLVLDNVVGINGGTPGVIIGPGSIGYLKGLCFGGMTSVDGEASFGRHLATCTFGQSSEGSPAAPSIQIKEPGFWRFRWGLFAGTHTIQVYAKQVINDTPRPSIIVRANPAIGIAADVVGTAPSGAGWVTVGPISVTASTPGVTWVELHNNYYGLYNTPTFFDHIVAT